MMFSKGFLTRLSKVGTAELDQFHGQPTPWLRASMRQLIAKVLTVDSWPEFFALINVPLPSKAFVQSWMIKSVANSLKKGYHKAGMDFSRVQRSGCSAILRKGESVSCQSTMRSVRLEEQWRWRGHETLFLDASALTYSGAGYSRHVEGRSRVALRHSGDCIEHSRHEGRHTIDIDLRALSNDVASIFIILSAWTTPLSAIIRPEVRCFDPDDKSGEPLARYELEGRPTGEHTAVIMCRVHPPAPGKPWVVTAIGDLGSGRASNYEPIQRSIAGILGAGGTGSASRAGDV